MMDTIYMVSEGPSMDYMLSGFTLDEEGIKQIIRGHYRKRRLGYDILMFNVDIDEMLVIVDFKIDNFESCERYYIQQIKRAGA
jgi:hypothetical protein